MTVVKFNYVAPETIEEVIEILHREGDSASIMAGGTDLLVKVRKNLLAPKLIVSLQKIHNLNRISFDIKKGLTIGATALLSQVAEHHEILRYYPTVAAAAGTTANTQVRNMGTVVGNICNASPSADNAPILLAMKAILHIVGPNRNRDIDLEQFFLGPGLTVIKPGEIVVAAFVPTPIGSNYGTSYCHISQRGKVDCAAVGVGIMLTIKEGRFDNVRIFVGACAPTPIRARKAEQILEGNKINNDRLIHQASIEASKETSPISDVRASAAYRKKMVGVMSERAITEAKQMAVSNSNLGEGKHLHKH